MNVSVQRKQAQGSAREGRTKTEWFCGLQIVSNTSPVRKIYLKCGSECLLIKEDLRE
jgi:hypothetical protein